jgi:hypothetical protein
MRFSEIVRRLDALENRVKVLEGKPAKKAPVKKPVKKKAGGKK